MKLFNDHRTAFYYSDVVAVERIEGTFNQELQDWQAQVVLRGDVRVPISRLYKQAVEEFLKFGERQ